MSKVAMLVTDVADSVDTGDLDVLTQCREITDSLVRRGHCVSVVHCSLDLNSARTELQALAPDVVFNLVESLGGTDRLMALATLLLDTMYWPYTGSGTQAILASGDKLQAKRIMTSAGIPTPDWFDPQTQSWQSTLAGESRAPPRTVIIKANFEHASFAMHDDAVTTAENESQLGQALAKRLAATGRPHMAEAYVAGREFNLSLLEIDGQPRVLSPAEIDFGGLPDDLPRIVGSNAKWHAGSIEYQLTPRRFAFSPGDTRLIADLSVLALHCWDLFGMRGYARVDFRVDEQGLPYVLEVNANPCLSQDAGFVAAASQSQLHYDEIIGHILDAALSIHPLGIGSYTPKRREHVLHPTHS